MSRMNWSEVAPEGAKALYGVHHYVTKKTNLPEELIHLVFLRVSQINGCAHCIDMHSRDLRKTMSVDKITLVPVWDEVPHLFNNQECVGGGGRDERQPDPRIRRGLSAAAAAFEPKNLVDLTITIAAMNAFNRLGSPFRLPVAAKA